MSVYLDDLYQSAIDMGCIILLSTTSILIIYQLFQMTPFIEKWMQNSKSETTVHIDKEKDEIKIKQMNIGKTTVEFDFYKIKGWFWKVIGIAYLVGIAFCYSIILVIPLVIIVLLAANKILKIGVSKGIRSVFRLSSPR
jgi:hypothetical protein